MTLPNGWIEATLGDAIELKYGKPLPENTRTGGSVPVYGSNGVVGAHSSALTTGPAIVVGRKGSAGKVHASKIPLFPIDTTYYVEDFSILCFAFATKLLAGLGLDRLDRATAVPGLNRDDAYAKVIAIPPAAEQHRIAARLDGLAAHLAHARAELERVPVLSQRMRERAVRRAFRGELTYTWRTRNQRGAEARTSDLPAGWLWCSLGRLAEIKSGLTLGKKRAVGSRLREVPYLRVANVQRGALDLSRIKEISATESEIEALLLQQGDILLNEGGDRDKLGRGWVWEGQIPICIHQNHVFRARLSSSDNSPHYISLYANEFGQDYFFEHGTQTTNLASISKAKVASLPIPVAPPAEQREIVRILGLVFARADRLEAEAARARALLDRLESAILAKAFRGELVPQDPNDEPASVLLERIRANRAAAPKTRPGKRAKTG